MEKCTSLQVAKHLMEISQHHIIETHTVLDNGIKFCGSAGTKGQNLQTETENLIHLILKWFSKFLMLALFKKFYPSHWISTSNKFMTYKSDGPEIPCIPCSVSIT